MEHASPYVVQLEDINKVLTEQKKQEKEVVFSISDVSKSIRVYADYLRNKTHIQPVNTEEDNPEDNVMDERQKMFTNVYFTLLNVQVRSYKNTPFVAHLFVSSEQERQTINLVLKHMTNFISKRNSYPYLKLEVFIINQQENTSIGSTPMERYLAMKKQSPAIEILKNVFNCELKF